MQPKPKAKLDMSYIRFICYQSLVAQLFMFQSAARCLNILKIGTPPIKRTKLLIETPKKLKESEETNRVGGQTNPKWGISNKMKF